MIVVLSEPGALAKAGGILGLPVLACAAVGEVRFIIFCAIPVVAGTPPRQSLLPRRAFGLFAGNGGLLPWSPPNLLPKMPRGLLCDATGLAFPETYLSPGDTSELYLDLPGPARF